MTNPFFFQVSFLRSRDVLILPIAVGNCRSAPGLDGEGAEEGDEEEGDEEGESSHAELVVKLPPPSYTEACVRVEVRRCSQYLYFFHVNLKNIFVSNIPIKEDDPDLPDYDSALKSESQRRRQELEK